MPSPPLGVMQVTFDPLLLALSINPSLSPAERTALVEYLKTL
jgi:hypothetical protein